MFGSTLTVGNVVSQSYPISIKDALWKDREMINFMKELPWREDKKHKRVWKPQEKALIIPSQGNES